MTNQSKESPNIMYEKWPVKNPKANLVISHGMAEHASRYQYVAEAFNKAGFSVYAIHHIGHGKSVVKTKGHWNKGDFNNCVDNLNKLILLAHNENQDVKTFLLGHSMGSFIAQDYIKKYGKNIDGLLLSGSSAANPKFFFGKLVALFIGFFSKEEKPNTIIDKLSFGNFNNKFKPKRTNFDWLSRDNKQVDQYISDPFCGFVCTTSFFREFYTNLNKLGTKLFTIPYDLPIYIFAGDADPVGSFGKGPQRLYNQYKNKCNVLDLSLKLYQDGRHEMLNEINKEEVMDDIISWLREREKESVKS